MDLEYSDQYRDLRSRRHARNRDAKQTSKYYGYRGVHPSWIGQPHYSLTRPSGPRRSLTGEYSSFYEAMYPAFDPLISMPQRMRISTWTKRDMWLDRDTDIWPLDRRHHRGKKIREKRNTRWAMETLGRSMKATPKAVNGAIAEGQAEAAMLCNDGRWSRVDDAPESGHLEGDSELVDWDDSVVIQDGVNEDRGQADDEPRDLSDRHDDSGDEETFDFVSVKDFDVQSLSSMEDF